MKIDKLETAKLMGGKTRKKNKKKSRKVLQAAKIP